MKALKMTGDATQTTIYSIFATIASFVMVHLPEIQAFITFSLTVVFLCYKIKEARAKAYKAERENDTTKRH